MEQERQTEQQQTPSRRPTRKQVRTSLGVILGLAFLTIVFGGYLFGWRWTGFPKQTFWDWLQLLVVPAVLALGGYLFTRAENCRAQDIANQRAETDRYIAEQQRQDDMLQAYLDQMGQLLLDQDRPLRSSNKGDEVRTLARARTVTAVTVLSKDC